MEEKINEIRVFCIENNIALIINCNITAEKITGNEESELKVYDSKTTGYIYSIEENNLISENTNNKQEV